ncbi:IclR family transcriptional regulator [Sphingomonas aracearum]|nr:IclR family transcriptional regulator C-terminal domain-containing protein [Sphingomonas aracearum]
MSGRAVADGGEDTRKTGTQTLERGLDLLELAAHEPMTLAELTERSGLPKGVAYRLVTALAGRGFVSPAGNGRFRGGPALLRLSHRAGEQTDITGIARPHLQALSERTGLSAFLGRRDGDHSLHLLRTQGSERVAVTTQPGTRRLLPETGMGKALMLDDGEAEWRRLLALVDAAHRPAEVLEALHKAARADVVLQHGPAPDHIHSVAAPVRDGTGRVVAAINVAAAAQYMGEAQMAELVPLVRQAAAELGQALGRS